MISFCTFSVLLTVLIVFLAILLGLVTALFPCIINHLYFPCSQASRQSILMFATVHWLPNSLTGRRVALLLVRALRGWLSWKRREMFSGSMTANLQIAPCGPKVMEGQFGGSKKLKESTPCAPIILGVWIYFLTFAACYPLITSNLHCLSSSLFLCLLHTTCERTSYRGSQSESESEYLYPSLRGDIYMCYSRKEPKTA